MKNGVMHNCSQHHECDIRQTRGEMLIERDTKIKQLEKQISILNELLET